MDNKGSEHLNLHAEHGLSYLIKTDETEFLFDFGSGCNSISNAKKMNIDFSKVKLAVCSHSHYDHSEGFPNFADEIKFNNFITGTNFFEPKYAFDGVKYTYLGAGFDKSYLKSKEITHHICTETMKIDETCYVIGSFQRTNSLETIPSRFVKYTEKGWVQDNFDDEICLAAKTVKGLVVIVGCSHPGIINMLETISKRFSQPIYAVLGGTHLVEADEQRIKMSVSLMKNMGVKLFGLSHCSGELAEKVIQQDQNIKSCHLAVGDSVFF